MLQLVRGTVRGVKKENSEGEDELRERTIPGPEQREQDFVSHS